MNKRIVVIVGVFIAGFGIGWGVTSLMVTGSGPTQVATAPPPAPPAPPDATVAEADVVEASAPVATAEADAGREVVPTGDAEVAASDTAVAAVEADTAAGLGGAAPGDTAAPAEADTAPVARGEEDAAPSTAPAKDQSWWDACRDKRCRVDFGRVTGGVSIRRASLKHGATIDWQREFDKKKKVGVLSSGSDVWVTVHGVGMTDGKPSAASITWQGGGETLTGVIALSIGDKQIRFVPPAP